MAPNSNDRLIEILRAFAGKRILVVGDVMLDRFVLGRVDRLNPEAPVPILLAESEQAAAGGAGNTAKNAAVLGATVTLIGVTGAGPVASDLKAAVGREGFRSILIEDAARRTTEKRRYLIRSQQMLRVDSEETRPIGGQVEGQVVEAIEREAAEVDAILVSDYAKGVVTEKVAAAVMGAMKKHGLLVMADVKPLNIEFFHGVTAISPNLQEAHEYLGLNRMQARSPWPELASGLHQRFGTDVYLTLSENGVFVWSRQTPGRHVPQAHRIEVADTSGCGDTAAVVLLMARLCGATDEEAAELANAAGAIVASKIGATAPPRQELIELLGRTEDSSRGVEP
ncbi:MAG: PfkB family carbohydrate kinase [Opitutaceae bacterium]